jgi:hypothetical protein
LTERRESRIAALKRRQEDETARERDELRLGRLEPGAPTGLQIPAKLVRVGGDFELQADLEDEDFGGFRSDDSDHDDGLVWRASPLN